MSKLLESQTFGEESDQPTLLVVHGLFGSGRNWRAIARHLSRGRRVVTVDMRNHGGSFHSDQNSYFDMADDLAAVIDGLGAPVDVLGHSMGGKAAMVLALGRSTLVNRLIVADIAPVAYRHSQVSNIDAMRTVPLGEITRRSEADSYLAQTISEQGVRAFLAQSLVVSPEGNRWMLNLDALAENMNQIVGFPDVSGQFTQPALFLRGGLSDYVAPASHARIADLFPQSTIETVPQTGHWLHAEAPRRFMAAVQAFLDRTI